MPARRSMVAVEMLFCAQRCFQLESDGNENRLQRIHGDVLSYWCVVFVKYALSKFCMIEIHEMPHHIASKLLDFGMNNSGSILKIELFRT